MIISVAWFSSCAQIGKESLSHNSASSKTESSPLAGVFLADSVVDAPGHTGSGFYDRQKAINGVRGTGTASGSLDVFSLDNSGASAHIVLSWWGKRVMNGAGGGGDFIVYENPFYSSGDASQRFMDLVFAEVSDDNVNYCGFAPDFSGVPETTYSMNPAHWLRFAGRAPVLYNQDSNNLGVTALFTDGNADGEGDLGGGDIFELDNLSDSNLYNTGCSTVLRDQLKANGFRYLRLVPAARRNNGDTGAPFVTDAVSTGPDIDGAVARSVE